MINGRAARKQTGSNTDTAPRADPHRPHQGRSLRPPLYEPGEVIDMTARIRRRETVSGLISEYARVA
jgi:hypothetical protein